MSRAFRKFLYKIFGRSPFVSFDKYFEVYKFEFKNEGCYLKLRHQIDPDIGGHVYISEEQSGVVYSTGKFIFEPTAFEICKGHLIISTSGGKIKIAIDEAIIPKEFLELVQKIETKDL